MMMWVSQWVNGWINEWMHYMNEWRNEWLKEWKNEWVKRESMIQGSRLSMCVYACTTDWLIYLFVYWFIDWLVDWLNEQTNEWMNYFLVGQSVPSSKSFPSYPFIALPLQSATRCSCNLFGILLPWATSHETRFFSSRHRCNAFMNFELQPWNDELDFLHNAFGRMFLHVVASVASPPLNDWRSSSNNFQWPNFHIKFTGPSKN